MAFSSKRGRPKTAPNTQDYGTAELIAKRAFHLTDEPIDQCLHQRLISAGEHRAGLHLRWLYTLRYGAPSVQALCLDQHSHTSSREAIASWRAEREADYAQARQLLHQSGHYECVMRLCVFNEAPPFLNASAREKAWHHPATRQHLEDQHQHLRAGLTLLATHWRMA
jgi:hypothetical protein